MPSIRILDSVNSPIQLGHLPVGREMGAVGFTICPGKKQAQSASGSWNRDLDVDLAAIHHWGAAAVVTLMPTEELEAVEVAGIGEACEAHGMEWYHLPIVDVSVPDAQFEINWKYAGLRLREHLRNGRNVLVHCRGGLGRSGVIAARLLIELGWSAPDAIKAVRAQRKGAIETAAQEQYVRALPGSVSVEDDLQASRVYGCILGGAVGDAFGYAVEFDRLPEIQRKYGEAGMQMPVFTDGRLVVSDDTQMTLFTLEAVNTTLRPSDGELIEEAIVPILEMSRRAYLRWGITQGAQVPESFEGGSKAVLFDSPAMRHRRAPGNTCLAAVGVGAMGTIQRPINDSKGCGAVMRAAPYGLIDSWDAWLHMKLGCQAGALTHGHVDGWLPAGMMASLIRYLMAGETLEHATEKVLPMSVHGAMSDGHGSQKMLRAALSLAREHCAAVEAFARLGEGWTGDEALAIAVFSVLVSSDFADAIRIASNHDGDSDSTASIAGQLYGACHGVLDIPHAWIRRLDVLTDTLVLLANFMQKGCVAGRLPE